MRIILSVLLFQFSLLVNAGGTVAYGFTSEISVGTRLLKVGHSNPYVNPDGCGESLAYVVVLDDTVLSKRLYATILAAHMENKELSFWVDGCEPTPWANKTMPKITSISVRP